MLTKLCIKDLNLKDKRVFIRVDFNVPLDDRQRITNDTKIMAPLQTIREAVEDGAKVILASHLGRPDGKVVPELSLAPVAKYLTEILGKKVTMAPDSTGPVVKQMISEMNYGDVILLENLRFNPGETANDPEFAKELASLADYFVNDAFGTAHRAHASTEGITHHIAASAAGYLLKNEIKYLNNTLENPDRPFMAIMGGKKISGKIPVIEHLMNKVDIFLCGGGMAFTFVKAQGYGIGNSLLEKDMLDKVLEFIERAKKEGKQLLLPVDYVVAKEFSPDAEYQVVDFDKIPDGWMGLDIGPKTIAIWEEKILQSKTIVWNGPSGAYEIEQFRKGTMAIARAVARADAISIVGGGETVAAIDMANVRKQISHVSTGGGACLQFLGGKTLPGVEALDNK